MRIIGAGIAVAVVLSAVVFVLSSAESGKRSDPSGGIQPTAAPAGAVRRNGSQPLARPSFLRLSGEVIGLAPGATVSSVTVFIGEQAYPGTAQGSQYNASVPIPAADAMVVIEARSTRVHYRSAVGSMARLRLLSGADQHLLLSEHAGLRLSPYSTALSWLVRFVLGGRDATSDQEFEEAVRSGTGPQLEQIAYALEAVATGEMALPVPFQDGYQLLQDRAAFQAFTSATTFGAAANGYLSRQQHFVPVGNLAQLPQNMVFVDGLPFGDLAMSVNDVWMLGRQPDGSYEFIEDEALFRPNYSAYLVDGGVLLNPIGTVSGFRAKRSPPGLIRTVERQAVYHYLRRLTAGQSVDVWSISSSWRDFDFATGVSETLYEYRTFSAADLDAWAGPDGWFILNGTSWALPWFCMQGQLTLLAACDYVEHEFSSIPGQTAHTVRHGWAVDRTSHVLQLPSGQKEFDWSMDANRGLTITNDETRTRFWWTRGRYRWMGGAFHVTRSLPTGAHEQVMVGLSPTYIDGNEYSASDALGEWESDISRLSGPRYLSPEHSLRATRQPDGTARWTATSSGQVQYDFGMFWEVIEGALYERRAIGRFASGPNRYFRTCDEAMAAGATSCGVQIQYFRPVIRSGPTYYGIVESYSTPNYNMELQRTYSGPGYMTCVAGTCMPSASGMAQSISRVPVGLPGSRAQHSTDAIENADPGTGVRRGSTSMFAASGDGEATRNFAKEAGIAWIDREHIVRNRPSAKISPEGSATMGSPNSTAHRHQGMSTVALGAFGSQCLEQGSR